MRLIPTGVEVFVALSPVDMRWSFDRLSGIAEEHIQRRARSGALFLFFGKRKTALKVLFFDGSGMCLFYKRLDKGTYKVPVSNDPAASSIELSEHELYDLLDGITVERGEAATPKIILH